MKRFRFLALVIAIITICSTIAFVGCNNNNTLPQETDKALVSLNINPSIEMVVDSEDRVVSIAAKNEDKKKARKMIKNYVIGLVVIAVILVACPYLVKGIAALIAG